LISISCVLFVCTNAINACGVGPTLLVCLPCVQTDTRLYMRIKTPTCVKLNECIDQSIDQQAALSISQSTHTHTAKTWQTHTRTLEPTHALSLSPSLPPPGPSAEECIQCSHATPPLHSLHMVHETRRNTSQPAILLHSCQKQSIKSVRDCVYVGRSVGQ